MATQHNFRIKNGLEVGGVLIVNSSGQLQATTISGAITATSLQLGSDANPTLTGDGSYLKITTSHGYADIGAGNTSYFHFHTGLPIFYFNKGLVVDSGIVRSYDEDLNLDRAGSSTARLRITAGTTISDQALTAPSVGVTNIVTNKVVKFDGTVLNDSNITDTGSLITLGSNTAVNGSITLSSNSTSVNTRSVLARDTNGLNIGTTNATTAISIDNSANVTMGYNLTVTGNLIVNGTTVTLNTATLDVEDKNITLNYGAGDTSGSSNGAGITIQDAVNSTTNATILWDKSNSRFTTSHALNVSGTVTAAAVNATGLVTINSTTDDKLKLYVNSSDGNDWNYISYYGRDATRDAYIGTDSDGDLNLYSDKNGSLISLSASGIDFSGKPLRMTGTVFLDTSRNLTVGTISSGVITATDALFDNGTSTLLNVRCDDGGNAIVRAGGTGQGTGAFEVSQDNGSHGGGMSYNGDGSPAFASGETSDHVTFYRINAGTRSEVFHYGYSSDTVNFNGNITLGGTVDGVDIAARDAILTSTTTTANAALPKAGGTLTGGLSGTTASFSGNVSGNRFILPSTASAANQWIYTNNSNTGTGSLTIQAGEGSSAYGGGLKLYSHSHASKGGWVTAGISSGSGGKFSVNNQGIGGGTDVFTVDASGNTIANGTGSFTGNVSANGVTIGASDVRSSSNILTIGGTSEVVRIHSGNFDLTSGVFKVGGTTVIDSSRNITGAEITGVQLTATDNVYLNGGNYEGQIIFGSNTTWRCGIRQHDDGDAELRIWAKNANGRVHIATGYDGSPTSIALPTDGFVVDHNNVGIGNFSATDPSEKLHVLGNAIFDNGTSTTVSVKCDDGGTALIRANGDNQGTGAIEVGQNNDYGGGMSYNGDGSPGWAAGETPDHITFYRMSAGTRTEVFHYPYSANDVTFNGSITAAGSLYFTSELHGSSKKIFSTADSYLRINQSSEFSAGIWMGTSALMTSSGYIAAGSNGGTTSSRVYIKSGGYNGTNVINLNGDDGSIYAAGNVGIGTATPQKKFHIEHTAGASEGILISGASDTVGHTAGILLRAEGGEANSALRAKAGIFLERVAGNYGVGKLHIANRQNGDNVSATISDAQITIYDNKVGIGTTSPNNKLQIGSVGSSNYGGNEFVIGDGTRVFATYLNPTTDAVEFYTNRKYAFLTSGSGGTGNVGIGTASPGALLEVNDGGNVGQIRLTRSGSTRVELSTNANEGELSLYRSSNAKNVYISSYYDSYFNGGNVIIGQSAVSYTQNDNAGITGNTSGNKLHVNGSIQLTSNSDGIVFGRGTSTFLKDEELGFGWAGGWYMTEGTYLRSRNNKIIYSTGSVDAASFRDSADTAFYVDPASASILNTVKATTHYLANPIYGMGITNLSSARFDTVDSGNSGDPLELTYYNGTGVIVGPPAGGKFLTVKGTMDVTDYGCFGQTISAMSNALKLEVNGDMSIRNGGYLYQGISNNAVGSWKTRIGNGNGSTFLIHAQGLNVNNTGYGSDTFLTANANGVDAHIFRDINSTAYYVHPGDTSNLKGARISGMRTNYASSSEWGLTSQANNYGAYGGDFGLNGDGNQVVYANVPSPHSNYARGKVWQTRNNDANENGADGGWNKDITGLNVNKAYMSVVYVKRSSSSTNGSFYHGCRGSSTDTRNLDGTGNSNPYFSSFGIGTLTQDVWYVSIGFIQAANDSNTSNWTDGGLWNLQTGERVVGYTTFKMGSSGTGIQTHRTYLYYSTDSAAALDWYKPGFYEVNGEEPTVSELLMRPSGATHQLSASSNIRAPIFYDSDSSAYYVDPSSSSIAGSARFRNGIAFDIQGDTGAAGDFSTYIDATNYPAAGYNSNNQRYWLRLISKGGAHVVLNTDGGNSGSENSMDHFTIFEGGHDSYAKRKFYVTNVGNVHAKGNITAYQTSNMSDIRLKKDIKPLEGSLEKVLGLQGVSFKWKESGKEAIGFIAQDVEKIEPILVNETNEISTNELMKTVDYSTTVALLVEAIKEQQTVINRLVQDIKELKDIKS